MTDFIKGEAETQYGDWRGTAAGDSSMMANIEDINTLADIKDDGGLIIGIGAGWVSSKDLGVSTDVHVYVYEPEPGEEASMTALHKKFPEGTEVPVKEILLHDVTPEQFALMFNRFDMQLRPRFLGDRNLRVLSLGDHPEQA